MDSVPMLQKIHFSKIYDFNYINAGDVFATPYLWFNDYFDKYSCITHSLSSVKYEQIAKDDVVIIGGGGLLNYNPWFNFNVAINKILDCCDNVIIWGAGFNTVVKKGKMIDFSPSIDYSRFRMCGVRDYELKGMNYVPCVSCMNPLIDYAHSAESENRIGSMLHPQMDTKELPIEMDNLSHFNNITSIINFISNHDVIVTNSYHCAYWSMLSNKRVVSPSGLLNGNKFRFMRNKPTFCDWSDLESLKDAIDSSKNYPDYLSESRAINIDFFNGVKSVIEDVIQIPDKTYEKFYNQGLMAETYWRLAASRNKLD